MLAGPTPEFPPLLTPGQHPMKLPDLRAMCAAAFGSSSTRAQIMDGLERLVGEVQAAGLQGEAWINGSFLTQKMNPVDADLVFMFDVTTIGEPTPGKSQMLQYLATAGHFKPTHMCDAYVVVYWPTGHPHHAKFVPLFDYWNHQWGFDRNKAPKGYAVVRV